MNIHEYQGKEILRKYNVTTPRGIPCFSVDEAVQAAEEAALRSANVSADPLDAAHAVVTALEPFVQKELRFHREAILTGMGIDPDAAYRRSSDA